MPEILALKINNSYHKQISAKELYEATRRSWKLSKTRASKVRTVLSLAEGRVVEVYTVESWYPSSDVGRLEFSGSVADHHTRAIWLDRPSKEIARNTGPVRYIKVD